MRSEFAVLPQRWIVERICASLARNRRSAKDRAGPPTATVTRTHLAMGACRTGEAARSGGCPWVKMQNVLRGTAQNITVHWFRNIDTGQNVEFKFVSRYNP